MAPYILKWDKMHLVWLLASFNVIWLIAMTQDKLPLKSAPISLCYDSSPNTLETELFFSFCWNGLVFLDYFYFLRHFISGISELNI